MHVPKPACAKSCHGATAYEKGNTALASECPNTATCASVMEIMCLVIQLWILTIVPIMMSLTG